MFSGSVSKEYDSLRRLLSLISSLHFILSRCVVNCFLEPRPSTGTPPTRSGPILTVAAPPTARTMDLFFIHAAICTPDAGFLELPPSPRVPSNADVPPAEAESLLPSTTTAEECEKCLRKKRKISFDAYPPAHVATTTKSLFPSSRLPHLRGCRFLLAQLRHLVCCCRSRRRYQLLTRYRYHKQKKPYSAISVHVEQLTSETYEEDDVAGIPDLVEVVRLQATGPTEVARALRKKLKYGSVHRRLRALTILDGLLQNGGTRLQRAILSDGPLLERLRICAVDPLSDQEVREKCKALFSQWVASSKDNPGLEGAKSLYNQLPKKARAPPQQRREQSKVLRETEEDVQREREEEAAAAAGESYRSRNNSINEPSLLRKNSVPGSPSISLSTASTFGTTPGRGKVKKEKKSSGGRKSTFNVEKERPAILQTIAASSVASTNLNNALKLVNRESHRVSDDPEVMRRFETCKGLRRQILRYIQFVETDEFLGGLIHANEELVTALMAFEVLDKSVDDDSDSELEEAQHLSRQSAAAAERERRDSVANVARGVSGIGISIEPPQKPPRPTAATGVNHLGISAKKKPPIESESSDFSSDEDEDEDDDEANPFGDRNKVRTPEPRSEAAAAAAVSKTTAGNRLGGTGYSWREV